MQRQMMNMMMMLMMSGQASQVNRRPNFLMPDPLPQNEEEDNRKPAAKESTDCDDVLKGSEC